jgi:hypothetical protein
MSGMPKINASMLAENVGKLVCLVGKITQVSLNSVVLFIIGVFVDEILGVNYSIYIFLNLNSYTRASRELYKHKTYVLWSAMPKIHMFIIVFNHSCKLSLGTY